MSPWARTGSCASMAPVGNGTVRSFTLLTRTSERQRQTDQESRPCNLSGGGGTHVLAKMSTCLNLSRAR